jgi:shikimate dehydrogenase
MERFGLIGFPLGHSFSKKYFTHKFEQLGLKDYSYELFPMENVEGITELLKLYPDIKGLNVTIPHKVDVIPLLDELDLSAQSVGAVNVIKVNENGKLIGYNSDVYGFKMSLLPILKPNHTKALILGTGGASKAVSSVFKELGIEYKFVSRVSKLEDYLTYEQLSPYLINEHLLIINCTPVGTSPNVNNCPPLHYDSLGEQHILYDLVYNPDITLFMQKGINKGSTVKNGLEMLHLQAEKAWDIWQQD